MVFMLKHVFNTVTRALLTIVVFFCQKKKFFFLLQNFPNFYIFPDQLNHLLVDFFNQILLFCKEGYYRKH